MRGRNWGRVAGGGACALLLAGSLSAQAVEPREPVERTELGGRVHLQTAVNSVDSVPQTEFILRRARLWAATRVNHWIDGAVQVDIGQDGVHARYAFVRFSMNPAFRVSFGQFKRAFDVFELTSSSQILVVERDGEVRGADPCPGIGGLCSYSGFSEGLELSSLDIGVLLQGELPGGRVRYLASVTNGPGDNTPEENHTKSGSFRLEVLPTPWFVFGINAAAHDYPNFVTGVSDYAPAFAVDMDVGRFERGPHLQAGAMLGDNWKVLDVSGDAARFMTFQGIATWRFETPGLQGVEGLEPVARVSWGDPNLDLTADRGFLFTPGFVLHLQGRNKIAANLDMWRPQTGARVWSVKLQTYLYF